MNALFVVFCTVCCNLLVSAAYLRQPEAVAQGKKPEAHDLELARQFVSDEQRPFYSGYNTENNQALFLNPSVLRMLYELQQSQQDQQPEMKTPSKRAQTFVRFGKRAQHFVRFGKRAQTFVRFG
ncbi:hypothetical protein M3Y96_01138800 [Aphelenchoides besseyi]|nr:hypothetical protein M3Y96_01138800 [Aphelenchoides besseyi]